MGSRSGARKQAAPQKASSSEASRFRKQPAVQGQNPVPYLQRTIGNQAVLRLMRAQAEGEGQSSSKPQPPVMLQSKLTVNAPGDGYEREADRAAEQVMRMPEPKVSDAAAVSSSSPGVQRKCACGGTCEECQKTHPQEEHARVQMKAAGRGTAIGMEAPPIVHEVLSSPGQPLDAKTRTFMEPRFGQDFSGVRVHTDAKAAESAKAVQARAYTVGRDIVFGSSEFSPGSQTGRRLLGHELAHVVQQSNGPSPAIQRQPAHDDIADLERELQSKMSERALLAGMLDDLEKKSSEGVYQRRVDTPSKGEEPKLKAGAQAGRSAGGGMDAGTVELLRNKIDLVKNPDGFTLKIRFEISYEGTTDKESASRAASDIPRIEKAIGDAWTVDLTTGHFAGSKFRTEPHIKFRSNASPPDDRALQLIVRRERKGDTYLVGVPGRGTAISFNPKHLEGDEVMTAAHELYHVFGFIDMYFIPDDKERRKHPDGPASTYVVGRKDPAGRGDLLGMSGAKLREWRDKKFISQADFDRQTRAPLKVWEEDADRILYRLGAPPNAPKSSGMDDPDSPAFDPQEALRAKETQAKQKLAKLQEAIDRDAETTDFVQKAERALQLDKEIAELQKKIARRKAARKP